MGINFKENLSFEDMADAGEEIRVMVEVEENTEGK